MVVFSIFSLVISLAALGLSYIAFKRSADRDKTKDEAEARDRASQLRISPKTASGSSPLGDRRTQYGSWVELHNRHEVVTFRDIGIGVEGDEPPYGSLGHITHLEPGEKKSVRVPKDAHVRVTYVDLDGICWLRRYVGQDYILERLEGL